MSMARKNIKIVSFSKTICFSALVSAVVHHAPFPIRSAYAGPATILAKHVLVRDPTAVLPVLQLICMSSILPSACKFVLMDILNVSHKTKEKMQESKIYKNKLI